MYSQSLDIFIAPLISSPNSVMNTYKKYGVVIDGVRENWHQLTMIILGWTSVKTKKKFHWHFISFFNNFYFVPMKNESIGEEHT